MQVVVPVKSFKQAKKRLATVLTGEQRNDLMKHMLDDVLAAITATAEVEGVTVVTSDAEVKQWVSKRALNIQTPLRVFDPDHGKPCDRPGLAVQGELTEDGLCRAYIAAAADLVDRGAGSMLLLPADIPLVTVTEIQALFADHSCPGVSLAAAGSDGGTNALLVSPPDIIAPAFGDQSCQRHIAHARERGLEPTVLSASGLSLDIDTLEDIRALLSTGRQCTTLRYLLDSGIAAELDKSKSVDKTGGGTQTTKSRLSSQQNLINRHVG